MAAPTGIDLPQLTLALFDNAELGLAEFIPGQNEFAFAAVKRWCLGEGPNFLILWGPPGTGKSHLLQSAVCALPPHTGRTMYVPVASVAELGPGIFEDLEVIEHLAIDDIHLIAGEASWERALFALFNRMQGAGHRLLLSSRAGPPRQPFTLADLNSRLSSGLSYQLKELSDADKQLLLQQRAAARGLSMSDKVSQYLVSRLRRDMTELNRVFERIDNASLSAGRELTIPFVRDVLGLE